jgi:chromosome segregation ATPase
MSDSHLAIDNNGNNLSVQQDNHVEDIVSITKQRRELQEQYNQAVQKVQSETATFESISSLFGELVALKRQLEEEKDDLGIKAQEVRERLKVLKREASKVEAKLQQVYSKYEVAEQNKAMAETHLATLTDKLKVLATTIESQEQDSNLGVNSMYASDSRETPAQKAKPDLSNPWLSGSFYLFAVVVVLLVLAVINVYTSWYTLILVLSACLLITVVIGSLQLRNDKNLSKTVLSG